MRIVILFDWRMEYLLCFIGPKDSHPNFNWMAIHSQILIGPWRMRRPLIGAKGFSKLSLDKGNKLKEGHGGLPKEGLLVYVKKEKKEGRRRSVRKIVFSSYVWRGAHGRVCVRIKHERNLCSKCLWQNLWTFGPISFFSQIHRWICVKFESILA